MKHQLLLCLVVALFGCKNTPREFNASVLTIAGSESELPLIQEFGRAYKIEHPEQLLQIEGGGSNNGIRQLLDGKIQIANSSRPLAAEDLQEAALNGINIRQTLIAQDVVVIITNPSSGINQLTTEQITDIYSGRVRNWQELGGNDGAIYPIGRAPGSGTRDYFQARLNISGYSTVLIEFSSYEDIVNHVKTTKGAVGYVSARFISNRNGMPNQDVIVIDIAVKDMPYYSPFDKQAIEYGDYPLTRPLYQVYRWPLTEQQRSFIEFELLAESQQLCVKQGYYPLSENQREINRRRSGLYSVSE